MSRDTRDGWILTHLRLLQTLRPIGRITHFGGPPATAGSRGLVRRWISTEFKRMLCSISRRCTRLCASSCPICATWIAGWISASRHSTLSLRSARNWESGIRRNCPLASRWNRTIYVTIIANVNPTRRRTRRGPWPTIRPIPTLSSDIMAIRPTAPTTVWTTLRPPPDAHPSCPTRPSIGPPLPSPRPSARQLM